MFSVSNDGGSTGGKKRPADVLDDDHEDVKRKRYEDENLEETVAEIVAVIEDQSKQMGPQVLRLNLFTNIQDRGIFFFINFAPILYKIVIL